MKNRDEYNKKFDKTSKKMLDVIKRSKDRKSNMVTASDRPYLKKVLDNITNNPRSLRKEPFSDMTNKELYELGRIYNEAYGDTRTSATPIGILNTVMGQRGELARRRDLEKNLKYVDPIIKMGQPTGYIDAELFRKELGLSGGKKVKKKPAKKIRGVGIARKGVRKCKMR